MIKILKFIVTLFSDLQLLVITYLPGGTGQALRQRYWRNRLRHLGQNVLIDTGVYFQNPRFIHIEDNCWIDKGVMILAGVDESNREKLVIDNPNFTGEPGVVYIGRDVHIGIGCVISGISSGVFISDECCLSPDCKIYAFTHHYRSKTNPSKRAHFGSMGPSDRQCLILGPVNIGRNTGVAMNSIILAGVSIPNDCFVGIGSVVKPGLYTPNSLLSGNPATKIADRFLEKLNDQPLGDF
jgi:acetyltransferase-like isoleucine patch superfamily enzyme